MTRIFIENQELDINAELTNQITYSIDDIVNIDSKSTSFTKTIIIPGTARNNKIFGNIFEFTNSNLTDDNSPNVYYNFNASKSAKAMIEMNGLQVMKGVMRLMSIVVDGVNVEYEIVLFGELGGFVAALGNKRIEDIDFSAYNHDYTYNNIVGSWNNSYNYTSLNAYFYTTYNGLQINSVVLDKISIGDQIIISSASTNDGVYTVSNIIFGNGFNIYTRIYLQEIIDSAGHFPSTAISSTVNQFGSGYVYPLIDYGNVSALKHDYSFRAFRPALFVREYMERIITDAGYSYDSLFFDTGFFRRLIIPNNDISLQQRGTEYYIDAYSTSDTYTESSGQGGTFADTILFDGQVLNNFSYSVGEFTSLYTTPINAKLLLTIEGTYKLSSTFYSPLREDFFPYDITGYTQIFINNGSQVQLNIKKDNGTILGTYQGFINGTITGVSAAPDYLDLFATIELTTQIDVGEKIFVEITNIRSSSYSYDFDLIVNNITLSAKPDPEGFIEYELGNTILMNTILPKNIFQKDFFTSIMKMFNLMVVEDKYKSKHLNIIPNIDFYNLVDYLDWSNKINRAKPIIIKPMSESNARYYNFDYKSDSDYYNDLYKKKWNQVYGARIFDNQLEFATEQKKVEVIFSPSVLVGYEDEDKVVSTIFKKSNDVEESMAHNIRIMQIKLIEDVEEWNLYTGDSTFETLTNYLYAGHFDNPDSPTADLNFGATTELFYLLLQGALQNNLFNAFYSSYMAEITDKDSRLVTAEIYLKENDIFNLDFGRFIYFDGALYRLIKIIDWSADNLCKVELLRVINTSYNSSLANIPHVKICDIVWSSSNLSVSKYRNGDDIPEITDPSEWTNAITGAWCYYDNDPATESVYGKLYNWYAVNDPRGLAPTGWKIASKSDYEQLIICADNDPEKLMDTRTDDGTYQIWTNGGGTNELGFNAVGVGFRSYDLPYYSFGTNGIQSNFWTSNEYDNNIASSVYIAHAGAYDMDIQSVWDKKSGFSIRLTLA